MSNVVIAIPLFMLMIIFALLPLLTLSLIHI